MCRKRTPINFLGPMRLRIGPFFLCYDNFMSLDFKQTAQEIYTILRAAKQVFLHFYPSPDPDSVGSTLAMKQVLEEWGVKATVIRGDSPIPTSLSCFPGFADVVDKNFTEINLVDFDLFLMLDISQPNRVTGLVPVTFP